tara:strand:- start:280 stop:1683 length:1404 start_codon:yes stop_codon:yes gene_type:complete
MGSSSTSWSSESNTHAGSSQVYNSSTWSLYSTTSGLRINAAEGQSAQLELWADEGDDNADKWKINVADGGTMTWQNNSVTKLTLGTDGALSSISAINGGIVFNEVSADVDFRIKSNGQANMFLVDGGNDKIGIGKVPVDGILEVKGQTASSPVISVDGSATNGFIMMSDNYVAGESQYTTGVTYSGAATYLASRCYAATDAVYTDAAGWKSSTDASSYRGSAIVLDGGAGSISLYYGATNSLIAPGSTRTLTRGIYLGEDGDVGVGTASPNARLHAIDTDTTATAHVAMFECTEAAVETADVLVRMDFSGDADVDGARAISFHDSGGEIGSITLDGNATAFNTSSDYRFKTDLKDIPDATAIINQLKIYDFAWTKNTSKRLTGVLAHEAQAIVPYAVNGEKDAMVDRIVTEAQKEIKDDQGNIIQAKVDEVTESIVSPQAVDYSKFVPLLIQSIQELSAKVTTLENA